jgi:transcriptional regulator with XRE-family HTH domain
MMSAETVVASLGVRIADERKASGLNQDELASLVGIDRQYLSEIERGKVTRHLARLVAVLDALGLELRAVPRAERLAMQHPASDLPQRSTDG